MNARIPRRLLTLTTVTLAALAPTLAMAHPGHGVGQNFVAGVLHPLTGLDHIVMIVAVSAWAARLKPPGRVIIAACLALFVAIGATLPVAPSSGPALEAGIALTVIGSGLLLALGRRWPLWATGTVAALFAMIHGFAHGAEGPANSLAYVPGLAMTTGGLALAVSFATAGLRIRPALKEC
ncbi:MAG: HupE/UreJ family protein [Steroidobacteraceae bacterium]